MEINHRIADVTGAFDTETGRLVCVSMPKHAEVLLCFKERMNIPFAKIKLYTEDRYADAAAVLPDATALGNEIAARWNKVSSSQVASSQGHQDLKDSCWYLVRFDSFGEVLQAPAMYKKNVDCFYSYEFSGIPARQLEVIREINTAA